MLTVVLLLDCVFVSTSAYLVASSALSPNAVIASVNISDDAARSLPDAAAKFTTPGSPAICCFAFQPASDMYCNPSADSVAENFVVAPISFATSFKSFNFSPVSPESAAS